MFSVSSFFNAFAKDLRIGQRIIIETFGGFRRSGWMNLIILVTMTSILSIFGALTLLTLDSQHLVDKWGSQVAISVYLKDSASLADMEPDLRALPHVVKAESISKEESWQAYLQDQTDVPDIPNPLPDTVRLEIDSPANVLTIIKLAKALPDVEEVRYPYEFLQQIRQLAQGVSIFGMLFTVFLGILTLFIISNTLSLLIQARRQEIEILRMMGVSNWYIRMPFLLQGSLYGLAGALFAYTPVASFQFFVRSVLSFFQWDTSGQNLYFVVGLMVLIGTLVGGIGATNSIKKYLNV
ncbi:MAG: ABC transporter permease [Vampirovibrionales bacterium]|jgi:cell division transport system permease protein|nr:ABC transporter permease [Vampirovibrionales bacterium]